MKEQTKKHIRIVRVEWLDGRGDFYAMDAGGSLEANELTVRPIGLDEDGTTRHVLSLPLIKIPKANLRYFELGQQEVIEYRQVPATKDPAGE